MEFFADYGLFLLQTLTIVLALILVIALGSRISGGSDQSKGAIKITDLSKKLADQTKQVADVVDAALVEEQMSLIERLKKFLGKSSPKPEEKQAKKEKLAVIIEFRGDLKASQVADLREEVQTNDISAID